MRLAVSLLALSCLFANVARAQERVTTLELGEWASTIATLQADVDAQGRVVHVCVDPGDRSCAPCARYDLALDDAGARAFRIDACDPATGATRIVLVDRSALFDHDDVVPRPRVLTIHAALVHDVASSGGSAASGGSALACIGRVQPFLRDLEHGTVVQLGPDRYDVIAQNASVRASVIDDAWVLSTSERIASEVDYVVVDRATGRQALHGHASLVCTSGTGTDTSRTEVPIPPEGPSMAVTDPPAASPPPDRGAHFTIRGGMADDWAFGRIDFGGVGATGVRSWFDAAHWLGWSTELSVSGFHASCSAFDGHCNGVTSLAAPLSVDALSFAVPFALRISIVPGGLQARLGLAPGLTYLYGSNGVSVESTVATGTLFGGFEYEIGSFVVGVAVGYRVLAIPVGGDARVANAYGQAMTMQFDVGLVF